MSNERIKELLSRLMELIIDKFEFDGAVELFVRLGFTEHELREMGYDE